MKNSYKLLGVFWDNLLTTNAVSYLEDNEFINELDDDYNLFDMYKIRKVNISSILKMENTNDLEELLNKMEVYDEILINIDYIPSSKNKILIDFYLKRVNQIYNYYRSNLINTKLYISSNIKTLVNDN